MHDDDRPGPLPADAIRHPERLTRRQRRVIRDSPDIPIKPGWTPYPDGSGGDEQSLRGEA